MQIGKHVQFLVAVALLGAAGLARAADSKAISATTADATQTVVVRGTNERCSEVTPERARRLADKASRAGEYQRAGECYLAAGEPAMADHAFVKAIAQVHADTSRTFASSANEVRAQTRQLKLAFRRQ